MDYRHHPSGLPDQTATASAVPTFLDPELASDLLLTLQEAASAARCSVRTLQRARVAGRLTAFRPHTRGHWLIAQSDLARYLRGDCVLAPATPPLLTNLPTDPRERPLRAAARALAGIPSPLARN